MKSSVVCSLEWCLEESLTVDEGGRGQADETSAADLRPGGWADGERGVHAVRTSGHHTGVSQQLGRSQSKGNKEDTNHLWTKEKLKFEFAGVWDIVGVCCNNLSVIWVVAL